LRNPTKRIEKAWGHEQIHFNNEHYCLKELVFSRRGNDFSMHFHANKRESWLVIKGSFMLEVIETGTADIRRMPLTVGGRVDIVPLMPHKLTALEDDSVIMEVSTPDHAEDNYRVAPGMSQR